MDTFTKFVAKDGREVMAFQGGWCPLSMCSPNIITIDGVDYFSVLHYVQCEKARLFNDHESCRKIWGTRKTAEQSKLAREIKGFDERVWNKVEAQYMKKGATLRTLLRLPINSMALSARSRFST